MSNTKSKICKNWISGKCTYERCSFAHGSTDLNTCVILCKNNGHCAFGNTCCFRHTDKMDVVECVVDCVVVDSPQKTKTCICENWKNDCCKYSDEICKFSHGSTDHSSIVPECVEGEKCMYGIECRYRHQTFWKNIDSRKTKLCSGYFTGECDKKICRFAHGSRDYNPSVECCEFFNNKGCKFGDRCQFAHRMKKTFQYGSINIEQLTLAEMKSLVEILKTKIENIEAEDSESIPIII